MNIRLTWKWFLLGGFLGYFIFHPIIMVTAHFMHVPTPDHNSALQETIFSEALRSFSYLMLPWSLAFAFLSALTGFAFAKIRQTQAQKEKLQGVIEMAGATCHELNQPMQVISGYSELLTQIVTRDNSLQGDLKAIIGQIEKMGAITDKIMKITKYETREYTKGIYIIDIDKASNEF